jgi:hypothetical protein
MGFMGFALVILGVLLIVAGTLLLIFLGTGIPLLVLAIRRRLGHRSRGSKIAMIVLGIIFGLTTLIIIALIVFLAWGTTPS